MAFKKGHKKLGGRKAGTPNKATAGIRGQIHKFLELGVDRFTDAIDELPPTEYIEVYLKLIEYGLPKLARTEITGNDGNELQINVTIDRGKNKS